MLHPLRPCHFTHVDKPFDSLLKLNESSVVGDAQNSSFNVRAYWITLRGIEPRVRRELLKTKRNPLLVLVELQNLYVDLIANVHQITRMREPSPRHVGDMQQTVEAAQIDERAVIGKILNASR